MIRARIKALVRELRNRASDQATVQAVTLRQCADRLSQILDEEEGGWTEGEPPTPERMEMFYVRAIEVYRWLPYKPDGARQMRRSGRWQKHQGYGFENHDWPDGAQWRRVPPPPGARP